MPLRRKMSAFISMWDPLIMRVIAQQLIRLPVLTLTSFKEAQGETPFLKAYRCATTRVRQHFANFLVRRHLGGREACYLSKTTRPIPTPARPWETSSLGGKTVTITCFSATHWESQGPSGAL